MRISVGKDAVVPLRFSLPAASSEVSHSREQMISENMCRGILGVRKVEIKISLM